MAGIFVHEELYRGDKLFKKLKSFPIVVCGCGAIGSNLIVNLIRQGFESITVIDMDRIEQHNLNNQIWGRREVGGMKASLMENIAYSSMGVKVVGIAKELTASNIKKVFEGASLVIDAFDNSKSRRLVSDYCKDKVDCLHIGLNTDYAEVIWNETYRVPNDVDGGDVCEYPLARNICMLSVVVATEVLLRFVETKAKESYSITLKDFKVLKRA